MHKPCLKCSSSDARYVYEDGSSYCFSCRTSFRGTVSPYTLPAKEKTSTALPDDCSHDFPEHILKWVGQYDISVAELIKNNVYYSAKRNQLIYSWQDDKGNTILWQARNFSPEAKSKCYTCGVPEDVLPLYGHQAGLIDRLVVVEDPVSAIKAARFGASMPCLGSDLSPNKLKRLQSVLGAFLRPSGKVVFWMDGNMFHKAQKMAQRMQLLGMDAVAVYTEEDPKACVEMKKVLDSVS